MEPSFFEDIKPTFCQDYLMESESSWVQNIDPLLRQAHMESPDFEWQQQQPLQRFITEPERAFFTTGPAMSQFEGFDRTFPKPFQPVSALPQDFQARVGPPSTSHELSSDSSSTRSPGGEAECYHDGFYSAQGRDDYTLPNATAHSSQKFSDIWTQQRLSQILQSTGYPCVNLSDVQGFADPQEAFEMDEAYADIDMRTDYAIQASESCGQKVQVVQSINYRDEALGASVRDVASPPQALSVQASTHDNASVSDDDIDAEGEIDGDADAEADVDTEIPPVIKDEPSDTEYKPYPRTARKRPMIKHISAPNTKRNRVTKTKSSPKLAAGGGLTCKICSTSNFKDNTTLQRHVASAHTRAFICVFSFAGCTSTFASKNEWKRHVSSQHVNLNAWVCTLGSCRKVPLSSHSPSLASSNLNKRAGGEGGGAGRGIGDVLSRGCDVRGAEFNRKDLFTQHLRRMHAPFEVKRKGKRNLEWEERVKELQKSCERVRRGPPRRLGCAIEGCGLVFEGIACWDERMEHMGKHLERIADSAQGKGEREVVRHESDELFLEWALKEGIVERVNGRCWRLCAGGVGVARGGKERVGSVGEEADGDVDADAEGEDEE